MGEIVLQVMTREMCHRFFREFQLDMDLFMDETKYQPYVYDQDACNDYFDRHARLGRVHFAIMLNDQVVGELVLKNIDHTKRCCTMGISMKNDSCKNQGYGTIAERLAVRHAFETLGLDTVFADALKKNHRSQHVLEKAGFTETHEDEAFRYYRCDRSYSPHI